MEHVILVRYAEIHLKGLNRPFFERKLADRIVDALKPNTVKVEREQGRIFVYGVPEDVLKQAVDKLTRVFGIHSVSIARCVEKDWLSICDAAVEMVSEGKTEDRLSFKVFARRADKRFRFSSEQICHELGHILLESFPHLYVDVHNPSLKVTVEIRQFAAFIYCDEYMGCGGLPVGCNGKAMLLISGGIDSPVAGYMIAKRGVAIDAVHFYSYPYTSPRARDKVVELAKLISRYTSEINLYLVPFTEIQLAIYDCCPQSETTIIMRMQMMKIAERIALAHGCQALITGESLGQVASQTIESLNVTNNSVSLPVFRPLIGFDKEEIVDKALKIGTYETSIQPFEDCCTVFVPQHPTTKPKLEKLLESEKLVDFEPMIARAIENYELVKI